MRSTICPNPIRGKSFQNHRTGDLVPVPCGSWSCPVCGRAKVWRLSQLAAAAGPERFVTLSKVGTDLSDAHRRLRTLSKLLRRAGKGWEYLAVPERHQNGSWHLHLLQRGDFIPQKLLSERARAAGMGRVVYIEAVRGDALQVNAYLCKYLTKDAGDELPKGARRYRASRGFWPGGRAAVEDRVFGSGAEPSSWSVVDSHRAWHDRPG